MSDLSESEKIIMPIDEKKTDGSSSMNINLFICPGLNIIRPIWVSNTVTERLRFLIAFSILVPYNLVELSSL
jgi:hypothetical protein